MNKVQLVTPFLKLLASQPRKVMKSLYHLVNVERARSLVHDKYKMQNGLPQVDLLTLFPNLNETVSPVTFLYGTSMPIDFVLLKSLAKSFNGNCDFFEIGSWRGESLAAVVSECRSCTSLSLSNAEMDAMGWGKKFQGMQRMFSKNLPNIKHFEGNSRKFDFNSIGRKFDLIFVDGDHSYEGVVNDTQKVLPLLRDDNSIIVWHDYAPNYEHTNWEVFAGILDGMPKELHRYVYHVSNTYCAMFTRRELKTRPMEFPTKPDKIFSVTVRAETI